ncbi:MAG: ABC transporter substrate-binding protein, partial [Frankiales bacterium]|nr:ABC transporter substrate-binding protein [Frankiales bacterium]
PGTNSGGTGTGTGTGGGSFGGTGTTTGSGGTTTGSTTSGGGGGPVVPPTAGNPGGAPGVTANAIYVGISYETNADALNAAFGATGISQGDPKGDAHAVVDDINAHGGIAGRKLVPVYWAVNAESTQTYSEMDQQACSHFTQDNHVFAVMGKGLTDNFYACILRAGASLINSGTITWPDKGLLNQFPYYYDAGTLTTDRIFGQLVRSLKQQSYFSGWDANLGRASAASKTKIGVLSIDRPEWNRPLTSVFLPAMHAAGYSVDSKDVIRVPEPDATSGETDTLNAISNAELRFRQDGVNHVILLDANGTMLLFFSRDAGSQHYYPRLGLSTSSGMETLVGAGDVDQSAVRGAMGFSWDPGLDLPAPQAVKMQSPATKQCIRMIDKRTGQNLEKAGPNAEGIAISYCDELYLLRDAINHAGRVITRDTVQRALESLHFSYPAAGALQEYFGPGRHDGIEIGWNLQWNSSCQCAKYVSGPFHIPTV